MPTDTLIAYFEDGDHVTATATATIVGKTFVDISGNLAFGVAEYDAASGAWLGVRRAGIIPVTCGAVALVAGVEVMSDSSGNAVVWDTVIAHRPLGKCLNATNPGNDAMIALYV